MADREDVAALLRELRTRGVRVVSLDEAVAQTFEYGALELERLAKRLRKNQRGCQAMYERFLRERNKALAAHNYWMAKLDGDYAAIAERRAKRLRNKAKTTRRTG